MATDARLGVFCKFYLNDGTYAAPTWVEMDLISDLTIAGSWEEGESSARRAQVKTQEPTLLVLDLSGRVRVQYDDPAYIILRDAFLTKETLDVMVLNGAKSQNGSQGYRFDSKVFSLGEDQSLGNVIFNDLAVKPCASVNDPKAVQVTGGVPVFSPIGQVEAS